MHCYDESKVKRLSVFLAAHRGQISMCTRGSACAGGMPGCLELGLTLCVGIRMNQCVCTGGRLCMCAPIMNDVCVCQLTDLNLARSKKRDILLPGSMLE